MTAYGPLCASFYDADKPAPPRAELDWYAERLPRDAGPVLEPMCGSGRLLVPLCEAGFNVHGVDSSQAMLARCEARLPAGAAAPRLFRQDVAELNLPFRYAAAFFAIGSLQLLVDPLRARAALERVRAHLVEPGLLVVDLFVPPVHAQRIAAPQVELRTASLDDGTRIALRSETTMNADARLARVAARYVHRRGAALIAEETETLAYTWYSRDEAVALAQSAGYVDAAVVPSPRATAQDARRQGDVDDDDVFALIARA